MLRRKNKPLHFLIIAILLFIGCENENLPSKEEIIAALDVLISQDEALGMDEFNDGAALRTEFGNITDEILNKIMDNYYPSDSLQFRFGRNVTSHEVDIIHEFEGDSVAYATITHTLSGDFITVIFDTAGVLVDSFAKPFDIDAVRRIKFIRINHTPHPRRNWRLAGLTPLVSQGGTKLGIDSLVIFNTETGELLYRMEGESILELFIDRDTIPQFTSGMELTMKLYVTNTGPEYDWESGEGAHMRLGKGRRNLNGHLHARRKLFDDGTHGDAVANDNEFTRNWMVHPPGMGFDHRLFKMFLDVIDYETLFSTEGEYHAVLWGFPYISTR